MTDLLNIKPVENAVFHGSFFTNTFYFFKKHFLVVMAFGLAAAFGRVFQLGGFGPISSIMHVALEIVVESARLLLVFYVLGIASIRNGFLKVKRFFADKLGRNLLWSTGVQRFKDQWSLIILNFLGFLAVAWLMNYLIELLAYQTCFYLALKKEGILATSSSEWTILLFFKNLSVIPFTLIFEILFGIWLTNDRHIELQNS